MKFPTKEHKRDLKNVIFDWLSLFVLKKHCSTQEKWIVTNVAQP